MHMIFCYLTGAWKEEYGAFIFEEQ